MTLTIEDSYAPKTYRIVEALINKLIDEEILDEDKAKEIIAVGKP